VTRDFRGVHGANMVDTTFITWGKSVHRLQFIASFTSCTSCNVVNAFKSTPYQTFKSTPYQSHILTPNLCCSKSNSKGYHYNFSFALLPPQIPHLNQMPRQQKIRNTLFNRIFMSTRPTHQFPLLYTRLEQHAMQILRCLARRLVRCFGCVCSRCIECGIRSVDEVSGCWRCWGESW
jgi:hypothetical protein